MTGTDVTILGAAKGVFGRLRRSASPEGRRSWGGVARPVATYDAASKHPLLPKVSDPAPSVTARQQRFMQVLARHLTRNDPWIRSLIRVMGEIHVGGAGPVPVSRFPERDALFLRAAAGFDHTGVRGWGGWMREDVYRNVCVDGEVFLLRQFHDGTPLAGDLLLPMTNQVLTSEFVPHDFTQPWNGRRFVNGVASVGGRASAYAVYPEHPAEWGMTRNRLVEIGAADLRHVFNPTTGSTRGEVLLAAALLRAVKAATLEDAELRRKVVASLMSVMIERPVSESDAFDAPSEDEVSAMIDAIQLAPGGVFELPYGYKANLISPPDQGANFEAALRWHLMAVCAAGGVPPHEVMGDWNSLPERMARYVGQTMERRAEIVRGEMEHQFLRHLHRDFVDVAMAKGAWLPPPGITAWDLYDVSWEWPGIPMASFRQELQVMMAAEERGIIDRQYITSTMFGSKPKEVARRRAEAGAQDLVLGNVDAKPRWTSVGSDVAARLLGNALEEETRELDLRDAADLDKGVLDDD